jgi:hypothetical protein
MLDADLLLRGTAWLSLAGWAATECLVAARPAASGDRRAARWAFTAGAVALLVHIALALHFRHGWDQADALRAIARETEATTGLAFRWGLVVNYAFAVLWIAELLWWGRRPAGFDGRPSAILWAVRAVFLVMFVNGAIVFVHDARLRALGALAVLAVLWSWYRATGAEVAPCPTSGPEH